MNNKRNIKLIIVCIVLVILLFVLMFFGIYSSRNKKTIVDTSNISKRVSDEQIRSFQDVKLIEELLKTGRMLDDNTGADLEETQKDILRNLGISENLINTYKVYTSEELLNSSFISSESEGEQQVEDWKKNYKDEKYIISQTQELAFLVNGREDEKGRVQYARLVEDEELYETLYNELLEDEALKTEETSTDMESEIPLETKESSKNTENETSINIRKVERLKYNVCIDYPENAKEPKYAIKINNESSDYEDEINLNTLEVNSNVTINEEEKLEEGSEFLQSEEELKNVDNENLDGTIENQDQINNIENMVEETKNQKEEIDYDSLEWIDYKGTIFIEENVTIYTKYKTSEDEVDYKIGKFKKVPELILSTPVYEIVEDEELMYIKFSNIESDYNEEVKFNISYGKKENDEEPIYSDWFQVEKNKFDIKEAGKYYIKFIATMPNKIVTDSQEMRISIGKLEEGSVENPENNGETSQIVDTTKEDIEKSTDTSLRSIKVNGITISQSIIDLLNRNGTAEYNLSSASSVVIRAYAQDSNAVVVGNGIYNFKNNKVTIKIQIATSDENKSIYTITVTRNSSGSTLTSNNNSAGNVVQTSQEGNTNTNQGGEDANHGGGNSGATPQTGNTGGSSVGASQGDNTDKTSGDSSNDVNTSQTVTCDHNWQAATCTTPKTCTKCHIPEGSIDPNNHSNYGTTSKVTTVATCTVEEVTTNYCKGCGKPVRTTTGKKLDHNMKPTGNCTQQKCQNGCGYTIGTAEHNMKSTGSCTQQKCQNGCGYTTGTAEHNMKSTGSCTQQKCQNGCGYTTGTATHNMKSGQCTYKYCSNGCGYSEGNSQHSKGKAYPCSPGDAHAWSCTKCGAVINSDVCKCQNCNQVMRNGNNDVFCNKTHYGQHTCICGRKWNGNK